MAKRPIPPAPSDMAVTIEQAVLSKALARIVGIVGKAETIPILANVRIEAAEAGLSLTVTDMDIEVTVTVPAEILIPGRTSVPARTLHDVARRLPQGSQVEIDHKPNDGVLIVKAGRSRFTLPTLDPIEFPDFAPLPDEAADLTLAATSLTWLIDKTRFAMSSDETRYYLNGIYLHCHGDRLRAVATDGHRLARADIPAPDGAVDMPAVIVPRKTVAELVKLLDGVPGDIELIVSETQIRARIGDVVIASKLIDGTFPDYERIIPAETEAVLKIGAKALIDAVERVAAISTDKGSGVKMTMVPDAQCTLAASSPEAGCGEDSIDPDLVLWTGSATEIGLSRRYLLDAARACGGQQLRIAVSGPVSPIVMTDADAADSASNALYVVMPMRV